MNLSIQKNLLICLLLIQAFPGILMAQAKKQVVQLSTKRKLHSISQLPFNEVAVLDNRFDTSKNEIEQDGMYFPGVLRFDIPASGAIKDYIESTIRDIPDRKEQVLYINLKQLRFGVQTWGPAHLDVKVDVYLKVKDGFRKLFSLNTYYKQISGFIGEQVCASTIEAAFDDLVKRAVKIYGEQGIPDTTVYTFDDINKNVVSEWSACPIFHQANLQNGIYRTFDDFRNNRMDPDSILLKIEADSTYTLYLPEADKRQLSKRSSKKSSMGSTYKYYGYARIWAVSFNGELYIKVKEHYFLPLYKTGSTFYFYVPYSLPNMKVIQYDRFNPTAGSPDLGPSNSNLFATLIVLTGSLVIDGAVQSAADKRRKAFVASAKNNEMRDCFLDMDTGDIIYY